MIRKQTSLWTQRDGRQIRICDMDDQHLANAMAKLERVAGEYESRFLLAANPFVGEIAKEMFDAAQDDARENGMDVQDLFPIYRALDLERQRREAEQVDKAVKLAAAKFAEKGAGR